MLSPTFLKTWTTITGGAEGQAWLAGLLLYG